MNASRRRLRNEGRKCLPPEERKYDKEKRAARIKSYVKSRREKYKIAQVEIAGRDRPSKCEICRQSDVRICFDHCHETNLFRGWLCVRCNSVLGLAKDDINILEKLIDYLKSFKEGLCHTV
jgi:hypothetical protein